MNSEKTQKYRSIDLFAGIGGIRLGFEQAFGDRIDTVFVSEWDKFAQKTYIENFGNIPEIQGDITEISESEVPEFDICLAGFPCQAFSVAGKRLGFNDDYKGYSRGTLFFDVIRICEKRKPMVIFAENVKGLVGHDQKKTFKVILGALGQIGYRKVHYKVLNSKDFGVPQNRERIYIVAFRDDIDDSAFRFPSPLNSSVKLGEIIEKEPVLSKYYLSTTYLETLRRHRQRHLSKGNGFGYIVRSNDEIASALVCGGMGRERNLVVDGRITDYKPITKIKGEINKENIRKLTPRECARLQGFPENFKLVVSDMHLYKQFGNSVSVPVIKEIALAIKKTLNNSVQ